MLTVLFSRLIEISCCLYLAFTSICTEEKVTGTVHWSHLHFFHVQSTRNVILNRLIQNICKLDCKNIFSIFSFEKWSYDEEWTSRAGGRGEDGWEYFYQGAANPQSGCTAPRWSRADWVSITNVAPFISALNQSELEFSGLIYIFFSLQNLALFSTNSMPCSRNCKVNEGQGFLNHAWAALAKLWGTSHSTCPGCSWQRWELLGFPFPDPQMKTTLKEAAPIACFILASNGWCLGGKRNHPSLFIVTSLP